MELINIYCLLSKKVYNFINVSGFNVSGGNRPKKNVSGGIDISISINNVDNVLDLSIGRDILSLFFFFTFIIRPI